VHSIPFAPSAAAQIREPSLASACQMAAGLEPRHVDWQIFHQGNMQSNTIATIITPHPSSAPPYLRYQLHIHLPLSSTVVNLIPAG
jgi:hypothetical protein